MRLPGLPQSTFGAWTHWDVTYGDGLFVAVGHVSLSDFGTIFTSPDGTSWRPRSSFGSVFGELRRVIHAGGRFVALGWNYAAYTSENGTNWTGGFAPGLSQALEEGFRDVCYGNGIYLAVDGMLGNTNVLTSVDGLNWTRRTLPGLPGSRVSRERVAFGNGRFVVLGSGSLSALTSLNGINWSAGLGLNLKPYGVTWGHDRFVAVGTDSAGAGAISTSEDGSMWTSRSPGVTNALGQVYCLNGLFVATGDGVLLTSSNGIDWVPRPLTTRISRLALGRGALVGISGYAGFAYWGADLYQSDSLVSLGIVRATPAELWIGGPTGETVQVETADTAAGPWQGVDAVVAGSEPVRWTDPRPADSAPRFYRAAWLSR